MRHAHPCEDGSEAGSLRTRAKKGAKCREMARIFKWLTNPEKYHDVNDLGSWQKKLAVYPLSV